MYRQKFHLDKKKLLGKATSMETDFYLPRYKEMAKKYKSGF